MNSFKNSKSNLDDFFAEARSAPGVTPAANLLKTGNPAGHDRFKKNWGKFGIAGIASVAVVSLYFVNIDNSFKNAPGIVKEKQEISENKNLEIEKNSYVPLNELPRAESKRTEKTFKKQNSGLEGALPTGEPAGDEEFSSGMRLNAMQLVKLSEFELRSLGITVLKDGDIELRYAPASDTVHFVHRVSDRVISSRDEEEFLLASLPIQKVSREMHEQLAPPMFSPEIITDFSGKTTYFTTGEVIFENEKIPEEIRTVTENHQEYESDNSLEKVLKTRALKLQREQDSITKNRKYIPVKAGNFIAWFRPEDAVLKALPEVVCNSVHAEMTGLSGPLLTSELSDEYPTSGRCYLDLCEKMNGAIVCSKVFPNPAAGGKTTVSFELAEQRVISLALYDLSGRKLREFPALKTLAKGKHEEDISLVGIEKGIYLIAIITEHGEKLSRRIIIE